MAFQVIAGLFSILSSALVYLAAAIFFSKSEETLVAFILALIVITAVLFVARLLFFKGEHRMKRAMGHMHARGTMLRRMALNYKHVHERKFISGNIARILAFGVIFYLSTNTFTIIYGLLAFAAATSLVMLISYRSKFIDIIVGGILGLVVGFFSMQYAPLIMKILGL
jgi:hypothetical protein